MSSLRRRIGVCYKSIQEYVSTDLNASTLACRDSIIGAIAATLLFHWLVDIFLRRFVNPSISEEMFKRHHLRQLHSAAHWCFLLPPWRLSSLSIGGEFAGRT